MHGPRCCHLFGLFGSGWVRFVRSVSRWVRVQELPIKELIWPLLTSFCDEVRVLLFRVEKRNVEVDRVCCWFIGDFCGLGLHSSGDAGRLGKYRLMIRFGISRVHRDEFNFHNYYILAISFSQRKESLEQIFFGFVIEVCAEVCHCKLIPKNAHGISLPSAVYSLRVYAGGGTSSTTPQSPPQATSGASIPILVCCCCGVTITDGVDGLAASGHALLSAARGKLGI